MGTTVYRATKAQAIEDELRDIGSRSVILDRRVIGSRLWVLAQVKEGASAGKCWIALSLIHVCGEEVAVKRLDETCGPSYLDCPRNFLDRASEPVGPYAAPWRDRVRAFHAERALARQQRRRIQPGACVSYGGETYQLQRSLGRRGWEVLRTHDQRVMRMQARQLCRSELLSTYQSK